MLSKATNDQETSQPNAGIWHGCEIAEQGITWKIMFLDNSGSGPQSMIKVIHMRASNMVIMLNEQFRIEKPTHREANIDGIPKHIIWVPEFTIAEVLASRKTFQVNEENQTITLSLDPRLTFRYTDSCGEINYIAPKALSRFVQSTAHMILGGESSRERLTHRGEFEKALSAFKKVGGFVESESVQKW